MNEIAKNVNHQPTSKKPDLRIVGGVTPSSEAGDTHTTPGMPGVDQLIWNILKTSQEAVNTRQLNVQLVSALSKARREIGEILSGQTQSTRWRAAVDSLLDVVATCDTMDTADVLMVGNQINHLMYVAPEHEERAEQRIAITAQLSNHLMRFGLSDQVKQLYAFVSDLEPRNAQLFVDYACVALEISKSLGDVCLAKKAASKALWLDLRHEQASKILLQINALLEPYQALHDQASAVLRRALLANPDMPHDQQQLIREMAFNALRDKTENPEQLNALLEPYQALHDQASVILRRALLANPDMPHDQQQLIRKIVSRALRGHTDRAAQLIQRYNEQYPNQAREVFGDFAMRAWEAGRHMEFREYLIHVPDEDGSPENRSPEGHDAGAGCAVVPIGTTDTIVRR